jgi:allantoinase
MTATVFAVGMALERVPRRRVSGSRPLDWYTGRVSPNTRALSAEHGGFLYDADCDADGLPY